MGLIEFFVLVVLCCILAAVACWALKKFASDTPSFVYAVIWGVACLIIIVALVHALGLVGYDPKIPRVH